MRNNVAWGNKGNGFNENTAELALTLYNNTSGNNYNHQYHFYNPINVFRNNLSFGGLDHLPTPANDAYNSWSLPVQVQESDFESLVATSSNFLRLKSGSDLINQGVNVGLPYLGTQPDLGAFEKE